MSRAYLRVKNGETAGVHYVDVPVIDGVATLPDGRTVVTTANIVRVPVLDGPLETHVHEYERGKHMAEAFGVDGRTFACAICGEPR